MIVGIPTDDGVTVSEHFGRSRSFLIAKIENGILTGRNLYENPHNKESDDKAGHGRVLKLLTDNKVNKVVCFNLNPRMQENLESLKIKVERSELNSRIDDILRKEVANHH
jgi:predicted Fe-Mo cluster-binding NifX family protein